MSWPKRADLARRPLRPVHYGWAFDTSVNIASLIHFVMFLIVLGVFKVYVTYYTVENYLKSNMNPTKKTGRLIQTILSNIYQFNLPSAHLCRSPQSHIRTASNRRY